MTGSSALIRPDGSPLRAATDQTQFVPQEAPYIAASRTHQDLARWRPRSWSAQGALSQDRQLLGARIHDLARNDGWSSPGVQRLVDNVIGAGWRLVAKPNARRLGIEQDAADELANDMESAWQEYCEDPENLGDVAGQNSVGLQQALAFKHWAWDGEIVSVFYFVDDRPRQYGTALGIIDPSRLSTPQGMIESDRLREGIRLGPNAERLGYYIRVGHPDDPIAVQGSLMPRWEYVERSTSWGRRNVIHHFEPSRAGQLRGVPMLSAVVKKMRMLGRYDEVELQAAVLNALLTAFIETPFDQGALAAALGGAGEADPYTDARADYHEQAPINMDGLRMGFLFPGEKPVLADSKRPSSGFEPFMRYGLRNMASAAGMSYEQWSMDWSQVNYSSARAALLEVWRGLTARQGHFAGGFQQPWYCNVMEEAFETGKIKPPTGAPSFQDGRAAYCAARWIGPGRGWVDEEKEATGAGLRMQYGLSTLERECAIQGLDWQDVVRQRARERKELEAAGLPVDIQVSPTKPTKETKEEPRAS
jgi:lambda family phage portal protein